MEKGWQTHENEWLDTVVNVVVHTCDALDAISLVMQIAEVNFPSNCSRRLHGRNLDRKDENAASPCMSRISFTCEGESCNEAQAVEMAVKAV